MILNVIFTLYSVALLTSMAGMEVLAWSAVLCTIFLINRRPRKSDTPHPFWLGPDLFILGFVAWAFLGLIVNYNPSQFQLHAGSLRWVFLLYAMAWGLRGLSHAEAPYSHLRIWKWALLIVGAYTSVQFFFGVDFIRPQGQHVKAWGDYFRATGFFSSPLTLAYSTGMAACFMLGMGTAERGFRTQTLTYLCAGAGGLAVLFSLSRGAWLAGIGALGLFLILSQIRAKILIVSTLIFFGAMALFTNDTLQVRLQSLIYFSHDKSSSLRIGIWHSNWEIFKQNPVFGTGLNQNDSHLVETLERLGYTSEFISHAHSNYLQMAAGTGWIGLTLYLLMCLAFLRMAWKERQWAKLQKSTWEGFFFGSFLAQIYFHLGGLTECNFIDGEVNHMLIFIWAMTAAARKHHFTS